jgi:hypothetical protein
LTTLKITTDHTQLRVRVDQKQWITLSSDKQHVISGSAGQKIKVESTLEGYFPTRRLFTLKPYQSDIAYRVKLAPLPDPQPLIPTWSSWTLIGIGMASLGWGIIQYQNANTLLNRYQNQVSEFQNYERDQNTFNQNYLQGQIGLGLGSAFIIAGSVFLLYKERPIYKKGLLKQGYKYKKTQRDINAFEFSLTPVSSALVWHF